MCSVYPSYLDLIKKASALKVILFVLGELQPLNISLDCLFPRLPVSVANSAQLISLLTFVRLTVLF